MPKDSDLVFRTWTETSNGYTKTHVWISKYYRENVAATLEGTIDNKAGYGSDDGAAYWARACERMSAAGIETYYNSSVGLRWMSVTISCQHYGMPGEDGKQQYCGPRMEMGTNMAEALGVLALLQEIGRPVEAAKRRRYMKERGYAPGRCKVDDDTFCDPNDLLAVLRRRKDAVEVEVMRVGPNTWDTVYVRKDSIRVPQYTLTDAHSAGMEVSA